MSEEFKKIREMGEEIGVAIEWNEADYSLEEIELLRFGAACGAIYVLQALTLRLEDEEDEEEGAALDGMISLIRWFIDESGQQIRGGRTE
jgi:hypothetical protein